VLGLVKRALSSFWPTEGQYRPGPYHLPESGGWLSAEAGQHWNWWQLGHDVQSGGSSAIIEACLSAYSQTVSMCPADHWRTKENGGRERITTSALSRLLKRPNSYQSGSDFVLNLTRSLYETGNAYALALRNDRFEVSEFHLMDPGQCAYTIAADASLFYRVGGNDLIEKRFGGAELIVPARDVLHIRLHTRKGRPLDGLAPIANAALDVAFGNAAMQQQLAFYIQRARPSYILGTDEQLTSQQVTDLRARWNEQSQGMNQGKTPILGWGLKPLPISMSAVETQLVEMLRMTEEHIAIAYRLPLQVLGISKTAPYASTEMMMSDWNSKGLGFALGHIEDAIGHFFGLKGYPEEYIEFDTAVLLRSAQKDRIDALAKGVQGGVYTPNEVRLLEGLPRQEHGDNVLVQQQLVPLDFAHTPPTPPKPPSAPPSNDNAGGDGGKDEASAEEATKRAIFMARGYRDEGVSRVLH
jgi:HK97 family phage portal protein